MNQQVMILLVDDDKDDRAILADAFTDLGLTDTIHFEEDGEKALAYVENCFTSHTTLPCLVVLDLNMPRMNGTQTLRHLKNDDRYKYIPVIIYSTSLNGIEKEECMQLGAYDYIIKPLTYSECINTASMFHNVCLKFTGTTSNF